MITWIRIFIVWAAICATCVPVLYFFFPWRSRRLGQLFMFKTAGYAAMFDVAAVFTLWKPKDIRIVFFAYMFCLAWVAISTTIFAIYIWRLRHPPKKRGRHHAAKQQGI